MHRSARQRQKAAPTNFQAPDARGQRPRHDGRPVRPEGAVALEAERGSQPWTSETFGGIHCRQL